MKISGLIKQLEAFAPPAYQESYDNSGLLIGNADRECSGVICSLDATEEVVMEAVKKGCNLVVAHHPIVFGGLKKITGKDYIERTVIAAIKNDVAIYAIHTNLDNVALGVNNVMADALNLTDKRILAPKSNTLAKLITFIPLTHFDKVEKALFDAGAGNIGNYSEVSFMAHGVGAYKANEHAKPFMGENGYRHKEPEYKLEVIIPIHAQQTVINGLIAAHPYEEVAYDVLPLANVDAQTGSGMIGNLPEAVSEVEFLSIIKKAFGLQVIKHTPLLHRPVKRVALCGGAGSFLIKRAIGAGADFYITGDVKYHEFFDANNRLVIADIGHWESEQFTVNLLIDIIKSKFPTFAVLKSECITNSVRYFL